LAGAVRSGAAAGSAAGSVADPGAGSDFLQPVSTSNVKQATRLGAEVRELFMGGASRREGDAPVLRGAIFE
jgi:hypothetical protein